MLTRRHALAGAASLTAVGSARQSRASSIDFSDPQQKLDAYVRMRNRGDGRWSFTRYSGTFFAKVEGEVTVPLMGIEGFSRGRMQKQPDGTYLYNLEEAGYHTDLNTGEVLDEWTNPLNTLTVRPKHYRSGQTSIFTPTSVLPQIDPWPAGLEYNGVVSPVTVIGDSAWCSEDLFVKFPNPRERFDDERQWSGPYRISTSLATHSVSLSDLENREQPYVQSTMAYTTINSWRPWMLMGQTPGVISWRLKGRKFESPEHMNYDWLMRRVSADHPALVDV